MQEMREKMKTDTSLLVVGGADEQVSSVRIFLMACSSKVPILKLKSLPINELGNQRLKS